MRSHPAARHFLQLSELILGHVAAAILGFILIVVGLGLGVTMIMLPVGLVVGLLGVAIFTWGLVGHLQKPVKPRNES